MQGIKKHDLGSDAGSGGKLRGFLQEISQNPLFLHYWRRSCHPSGFLETDGITEKQKDPFYTDGKSISSG